MAVATASEGVRVQTEAANTLATRLELADEQLRFTRVLLLRKRNWLRYAERIF